MQGWLAIVIARRAFATDAPQIRIAPLNDEAATDLFLLMRRATQIILDGWVLAGLAGLASLRQW